MSSLTLNWQPTFVFSFSWLLISLLSCLDAATAVLQRPLGASHGSIRPTLQHLSTSDVLDVDLFTPIESLSALSDVSFTTLSHPLFPNHSARIKKTNFCDPSASAYTGYIDVGARHLFFYFFESRRDPAKDDIIFWTNGGPGASAAFGVFMENGPCRMVNATATEPHAHSWNEYANIFFVDQPVGVGFSYAEYGEHVDTTEDAAQDIAAFVALFFENFPSFKGRSFHMAGESYAGRYVPLFAATVYDQNAALIEAGLTPVNLTSAIIGNGLTERGTMFSSYYDMACTPASLPPVLGISTCVRMKQAVPRCLKWHKETCVDHFDSMSCRAATDFCSSELEAPYEDFGLNVFDMSKPCEGPRWETFCYYIVTDIISYLSQPSIRNLLGVDPAAQNFSVVSWPVNSAFDAADDVLHDSHEHVAALLERGVRVLIYVGTYDWGCNWVGNERWTLALEWSGREAFVDSEFREWTAGEKVAGKVRAANGLTFSTVDGSGHMVPYDKPVEALALINRWLDNVPL